MKQKQEDLSPLHQEPSAHRRSEFEEAMQSKSFVRAARIAESIARPQDEIKELQQEAIKQFMMEHRNPQGAIALVDEYHFDREDLDQLLRRILQEAEVKRFLDKKQYDLKTMRYLNLSEWALEYFKITKP